MKTIKEALYELKTFSEFVVTLGYAAILQNDVDLAIEAQYVKDKIRSLSYDIRIATIYAVRSTRSSKEEITQLASLLQVGVAAKEISDGIDDLVEIVIRGGGAHPVLRTIYGNSETVIKIQLGKNNNLIGKTLQEAKKGKFEILFVRRGKDYIINDAIYNVTLKENDVIIIKSGEEESEKIKEIFK